MSGGDVIDGEYREETPRGSALATRERWEPAPVPQPPALFGTDDPVEVVEHAVRVADALKGVVVAKKLISNIQGREYPLVEAWTTLAAMLRLTAVCEWSRKTPEGDGWEARALVRDRSGAIIGAAEAQCTRGERTWAKRDDYALRSMAQTRATSKALRSVLGFIMVLAGYEATPEAEMPGSEPPSTTQRAQASPPPQLTPLQVVLAARMKELGMKGGTFRARCETIFGAIGETLRVSEMSDEQVDAFLATLPTEEVVPCEVCGGLVHVDGCPEDPSPTEPIS